jgi:uncharacterized protein YajQ (UPF0234 family)
VAEHSFDVVSKVDRQEVGNAVDQTAREIKQRYDFKGTGASISLGGDAVDMRADAEGRVRAVLEIFQQRLVRRGVSLKAISADEPRASGKEYRISARIVEGISSENVKKIGKMIRDEGFKDVRVQNQGDELRVSSKSRNTLQQVIALLEGKDLDVALQFVNYR